MTVELIESYEEAQQTGLPLLAANLTWIKVNGGHTIASLSDWEEDRDPVVGEEVLVSDGGPFLRATIQGVRPDGEIPVCVAAYARSVVSA